MDSLASKMHASFDLISLVLPRCHTMLTCLACLAKHSRSHRRFQFLASIIDGFFEFLVLRVNEINSSKFSGIFPDKAFHQTTFASPSAWRAFPSTSRALAIDDLAWM